MWLTRWNKRRPNQRRPSVAGPEQHHGPVFQTRTSCAHLRRKSPPPCTSSPRTGPSWRRGLATGPLREINRGRPGSLTGIGLDGEGWAWPAHQGGSSLLICLKTCLSAFSPSPCCALGRERLNIVNIIARLSSSPGPSLLLRCAFPSSFLLLRSSLQSLLAGPAPDSPPSLSHTFVGLAATNSVSQVRDEAYTRPISSVAHYTPLSSFAP